MPANHNRSAADIRFAAEVIAETFDESNGRFPPAIFYAISSTAMLSAVELFVVQQETDSVLLTQRDKDDPYFPGMWHLPGVIVTSSDITSGPSTNAYVNAAMRAQKELGGTNITRLLPISYYLDNNPRISRRGPEAPRLYGARLLDRQPKVGQMFQMKCLPHNLQEDHVALIRQAPEALGYAEARMTL